MFFQKKFLFFTFSFFSMLNLSPLVISLNLESEERSLFDHLESAYGKKIIPVDVRQKLDGVVFEISIPFGESLEKYQFSFQGKLGFGPGPRLEAGHFLYFSGLVFQRYHRGNPTYPRIDISTGSDLLVFCVDIHNEPFAQFVRSFFQQPHLSPILVLRSA